MVTRADLTPGMTVRNLQSGKTGVVRADPHNPSELRFRADYCVAVASRKPNNRLDYPSWRTDNIEIVHTQ